MPTKRKTIFDAIAAGNPSNVKRWLTRDPALLEARNARGLTPLMAAVYAGHDDVVVAILERGPTLDVFEAAALGDTGRLERLLKRSTRRATAYSKDGFTALHLAAFFGRVEAVELLLDRGAPLESPAKNPGLAGATPLLSATAGHQTEVVRVLLERGADANATQAGGWNALHMAAAGGDLELVEALLAGGADPTQMARDRTRPIEFAIENGHQAVVRRLKEAM